MFLGTEMPILKDLVKETAWCGMVTREQAQKLTQLSQPKDVTLNTLQEMPFF